ncbi:asparagine synthase (glutamine-hydrolyzing) [Roseivirga sp.]|uniref:asparagine synthase (glutamine-hydrolyzing) n=1 Tax=Roseivirga sp. TaxID=1964215 RepID=UPI003B8B35F2
MCGITGIISKQGNLADQRESVVAKMNVALIHRGPDSEGSYSDEFCALAMRRLSIIDLKNGDQPAFNENKDVLVFQNGEIYNFRELKAELENLGHQFTTDSDTEVLAHLYEEYKEKMLSHLQGMFAFCIYDKQNNSFLMARDRFGEKPLYYWHNDEELAFSSELTSLLEHKSIRRVLNQKALPYYLRTSLIPEPLTLFEGVEVLPAGHFLKIEGDKISVEEYHTTDFYNAAKVQNVNEAKELIKPALINAVKKQMVSDVPLGAFLSGGIDSSTMVALLQQQSSKAIATFNVKFEDQNYDESPIAKAVAQHCGTDHHEVVIPNQEFSEDIFWKIIEHMGQPFRDSSAIPSYFVSKAIGQHVKVAISGDGGDEQFGGYDIFQWYKRILKIKRLNVHARKSMLQTSNLISYLPGFSSSSKLRQARRALKTAELDREEIAIALNEMFDQQDIENLLSGSDLKVSGALDLLKAYPKGAESWSDLRRIMYYRTRHTLTANMLVKVDRMSMANSLEVRAPFLDPELTRAAASLPDHALMRDGLGKMVLREIMKDQLPAEVFSHPKQGFNIPLHKYQNETYRTLAKRLLFQENPLPSLFASSELKRIYHQGLNTMQDNSKISAFRASHQLWLIMQFLGWAKRFKISVN